MDNHDIERLISQTKSNDVDAKVDAVAKLQQAFEAGAQLSDTDELINVLKPCLRSSNQHLSAATLAALPPLFSLLATGKPDDSDEPVDVNKLRHAMTAFLPSGGLLDRLGDNRERSREKARESMVILGGLALRCGTSTLHMSSSSRIKDTGKGPETPLMIWERFLREGGLQSKVWRVREQAILTLVQTRRLHPMIPLKPYLPVLVELLEDTDGTVRECARQSVVELFTGPTVTDAARADLKKEMAKKNVRKTIVDSVLQKLMAGGTRPASAAGSHTQDDAGIEANEPPAKKEYIPPSLKLQGRIPSAASTTQSALSKSTGNTASTADSTSRPASRVGEDPFSPTAESCEISAFYIASVKDLENEFNGMSKFFEGRETEHNWAGRERSINRVRGMLKGDIHVRYADTFLACLKGGFIDASFKSATQLASLRTTLSTNTCHLYSELAVALGSTIDSICEPILTRLIGMASLTKKIVAILSQQTVETIVSNTSPHPKIYLNLLWQAINDKNTSARQYGINHLKAFLRIHGERVKHLLEGSSSQEVLEKSIKKALGDSSPAVRETARATFWVFDGIWKERAAAVIASLDLTARKQLEKACPEPGRMTVPITPQVKKSSVAAAIAASRAKAKAIANAPPTLRHQATSTSQILQRSVSPTPRPLSRSSTSPSSGLVTIRRPSASRPLSPLSPPARKSASFSPSLSSPGFSPSAPIHNRTRSTETPPSPTPIHRRFASTHLSPPSSPSARDATDGRARSGLPPSPRLSLDGAFALSVSPTRQRAASPSRIPSPTSQYGRRSDVRASLISFTNNMRNLNGVDESLLLAQSIPLPEDTDSENESQMMSFSTPFEKYNMSVPKTNASSLSAGSPPASVPEPIVEDALRARAEQAESAAERLLELNETDDEESSVSLIPASLLPTNGGANGSRPVAASNSRAKDIPPSTPVNRRTALLRQAALFKDSPVNKKPASLIDVLHERKHETGWWLKRISLVDKGSPLKGSDKDTQLKELENCISALEDETGDVSTLKKLALICLDNPAYDDRSEMSISNSFTNTPTPANGKLGKLQAEQTIWHKEKVFDRMFNALLKFLRPERAGEDLEYGLIALWEILENQSPLVEGREADVFTHLLQIRFCNNINVLEATNTIRDALVARIDPLYGLTTLHASLRAFHSEPLTDAEKREEKSASYAFGLIALGKFILHLPAEVLEDELPRLRTTLTTALSDSTSLVVRESAATCIIASQLVLRDETALFTLLDGLPDEKKNLLTYLFDKHGARSSKDVGGTEKLEKEMRRLDGRTNTPPRSR